MFGVEACGDDTAGDGDLETRGGVREVGGDDTAVDGDLGTEGGVGDSEVVGGDTWGMKGIKFDTLGGDAVRFESEKVKDTSGEGLMYVAVATDPTVLGSGLFCRQ